ncbi:MAG: DUF3466 family protein [Chthonomonadaceae bacterium]|nr:DUF3466 family protein [Chthonomonadaceae bacterium]
MKPLCRPRLAVNLIGQLWCLSFLLAGMMAFPQSKGEKDRVYPFTSKSRLRPTQTKNCEGQASINQKLPRYRLEKSPAPVLGWRLSSINNLGQYTAYQGGSHLTSYPFYFAQGKSHDLSTFFTKDGVGVAINNRGEIAGTRVTIIEKHGEMKSDEVYRSRAVLLRKGKLQDLGTLKNKDSSAVDLNDQGDVVGNADNGSGIDRAFLYHRGKVRGLGTLGGSSSQAHAINNKRQIVGNADTSQRTEEQIPIHHAFLWEKGKMHDLGTLGGEYSDALDINDRGEVVGFSWLKRKRGAGFVVRAFLYRQGKMKALPTPAGWESRAFAINRSGDIVGMIFCQEKFLYHAALWSHGKVYDLNTLVSDKGGRNLESADGMNDRGQIFGTSKDGLFLLTPYTEQKMEATRE